MSNVYAPPQDPAPGNALPPPTGAEPKSLNTVLVILMVLSALGLAAALLGIVSNLAGIGQHPPPPQPGMPAGFIEAQAKMYEELQEASMKGPATIISLLAACIEGYVLFTAWGAKQYKDSARESLVRVAVPVIMAFTLLKLAWGLFIALRTYTVFTNFMERMQASMPGPGAGKAMEIMNMAIMGGTIGGALIAVFWGLGLVFFYNWSRKVLARPDVEAYFAARAA